MFLAPGTRPVLPSQLTSSPEPARRLSAVWFADIVGYTTLSAQDEDGAIKVVNAFQRLAAEIVPQYSGRVVKYIGDAALAEFASTDGAIRSALALVERFQEDPAAKSRRMTIRVGVNVGEVIPAPDGDIYGDGVNLASRLQNQAAPGQVVASEAVHAQIRQRPVFRTEALGHKAVKGIADPVRVFAVTLLQPGVEGAEPRPQTSSAAAKAAPRSLTPWLVGAAVLGIAAVAAVMALGAGDVSVVRATYPVVEGGLEVAGPITVEFTGAVDAATATSRTIRLLDAEGRPVQAEVSVATDERSVVVRPRSPLAFASVYTLVVSDSLLSSGGVRLATAAGADVPAALLFAADNREVRLEPTAPLSAGARYVVRIVPTLTAATGLAALPDSLAFRVASRRADAPRAVAAAPGSGAAPAVAADSKPRAGSGAGTLSLTVVPAAAQPFIRVVIDGDTVGPAPLKGFALSQREHTVVLVGVPELSSFALPVFWQTVTIQPGEAVTLAAQITGFGSVDVVSESAGAGFIDGRQVGRTPLAGYPVVAGTIHRLEVRPSTADQAKFAPYTTDFRVQPLEWKSLGRVALPAREQ